MPQTWNYKEHQVPPIAWPQLAQQVAVPCTVDNDLMMVDTSFGFDTACTEAFNCRL